MRRICAHYWANLPGELSLRRRTAWKFTKTKTTVDAIKRFFAENGKALAVGVVLGIGALVGWRYWTSHQADTAKASSQAYETAVSALQAGKPESFVAAEKFAADNKNTYGALASLELAQQYVEKKRAG